MMEALLSGLIFLNIAQLGLIWYKLGRVERELKNHCDHDHCPEKSGEED